MSKARSLRACRTDKNHKEIVRALRAAGRRVLDLSRVGDGCPDLLVTVGRRNLLMEVKSGKGELTPDEKKFFAEWPGEKVVVRSVAEALAATGVVSDSLG